MRISGYVRWMCVCLQVFVFTYVFASVEVGTSIHEWSNTRVPWCTLVYSRALAGRTVAPWAIVDGTGVCLHYASCPVTSQRMPSDIVIWKLQACYDVSYPNNLTSSLNRLKLKLRNNQYSAVCTLLQMGKLIVIQCVPHYQFYPTLRIWMIFPGGLVLKKSTISGGLIIYRNSTRNAGVHIYQWIPFGVCIGRSCSSIRSYEPWNSISIDSRAVDCVVLFRTV